MYQIKLLNKISPLGLRCLPGEQYTCGMDVEDPHAMIVRSASVHDMPLGKNLLAIARAGAGINNIPVEKCSELGIAVFNTPGANANAVKELTIMGLLMSARKIFPAMQWVQELKGKGDEVPALVEKGKGNFTGPELMGKTLGVIGLGTIGVMVAGAAVDLGMEVYGYDPFLSVDGAFKIDPRVNRAISLEDIYSQCDFISLHLPSTGDTRGMINAKTLPQMRPGVRILNFSRGDLVNSSDIVAALNTSHVCCYLTDFPDQTLLGEPGVIALPHLGASTPESEENCAIMAASEIKDYLETGNVRKSVNLPDMQVPRSGRERLAVIHYNVPTMISRISGLAPGNINSLTNHSKDKIGYLIMDLDVPIASEQVEKIAALDGVIRVRHFK